MSLNIVKLVFVTTVFLVLSACAQTPYHIPITSNIHKNIDSTSVNIGLNQEEIYMKFRAANSSGSQFGFLGDLIALLVDSAINSSESEDAEKLAKPIKDALIDMNFAKEISTALSKEIKSLKWVSFKNAKIISSYDNKSKDLVKKSGSSAVLVIRPDYYISENAKSFKMDTSVTLYPNNSNLNMISSTERPDEEEKIIYRNKLHFTYAFPVGKKLITDKKLLIKKWAENKGKYIKYAIRKGVAETAKMLAIDLSKVVPSKRKAQSSDTNQKQVTIKSKGSYKLVRSSNGSLIYSIN